MMLWRLCAGFGLLTIALATGFSLVPDIDACGPAKGAGQWVDFQNINSVSDVRTLIRDECAERFVPALKFSMIIDAVAFIPAYLGFLGLAIWASARRMTFMACMSLALLTLGIIADQWEGLRLLDILNRLPGTDAMTTASSQARMAKELFLALSTIGIGALFARHGGRMRFGGWIVVLGGVIAITGFVLSADWGETGLLLAWLAVFGVAAMNAIKRPSAPV
jgi:hypothetical protein